MSEYGMILDAIAIGAAGYARVSDIRANDSIVQAIQDRIRQDMTKFNHIYVLFRIYESAR